jgi:hypothetical protein
MNEEALKYAHGLFTKDGYNGSLDDFKALVSTDKKALDYSYGLFKKDGYADSIDDYSALLGLGKQTASPLGSGGEDGSAVSAQQPVPSEKSGATSDPVQQEIDRLQSKYESALKTNSNFLTPQENQELIKLKKSQQAVARASKDFASSNTGASKVTKQPEIIDGQGSKVSMRDMYLEMNKKIVDGLKNVKGDVIAKVASIDPELMKLQSQIRKIEESEIPLFQKKDQLDKMYSKMFELANKQMSYIDPSQARKIGMDPEQEAVGRYVFSEKISEAEKKVALAESMMKAGEDGAQDRLSEAKQELDFAEKSLKEINEGTYSPTIIPDFGKDMYHAPKKPGEFVDVQDLYSQFDIAKIQERSKLASEINLNPDSPVVRGMSVQAMRDMHSKKMQEVAEYQKYAPNAFKNINLDELLLESEKKGGGLISELRAEGKVDRAFRILESDFMMYLNGTNPSRYSQYKSRMDEIDYKRNNGQPLSFEEEEFASSFTKEALQFRQLSDLKAARDIESSMDMRTFQLDGQRTLYDMKNVEKQIKDQSKLLNISGDENIVKYNKYKDEMTPVNQGLQAIEAQLKPFMAQDGSMRQDLNPTEAVKVQELIDQYNIASEKAKEIQSRYSSIFDENGNVIPGVNSKKLQVLYEQYNTLTKDYDKIQQTTGVTEDKLNSLNNTYTSLGQSKLAYEFIDKDYLKSKIEKDAYEKSKAERNRIAKEGTYGEKAGALFDTMGTALATSIFSIAQAPKVTFEALGGADAFAESLYDWSTDVNTRLSKGGTDITEGSSAFNFMNKTAEAFGAYATSILFGGVGGLAVKGLSGGAKMMKAAQVTSGFMQGYLMGQGDAYRQALKSGMSTQEAGVVANIVGVMNGIGESLFNEIDVFKPTQRYSLGSLIREKGFEDGLTAWAPQYVKSIFNEAAPEFLEESASELLNQTVNNAVNGVVGREVLNAGWNMSAVVESGFSGSLPPAFLGVMKFGINYRTPQEQATLRNMGENGADIQVDWANSGATVEEMKDLGELTNLAKELNNIPSYAELTGDNKDRVFNLLQLKKSIVDARKETGLLPLDKEDIDNIDKEVMSIYEEDKIIKETATQESAEGAVVENGVVNEVVVGNEIINNENNTVEQRDFMAQMLNPTLFEGVGVFANELGGSGINSVISNHNIVNGIDVVEFSNPNTGVVDVVTSGVSDHDFVGFYRLYEDGKPTNKWSSKFENQSRNKGNFKTMISEVQARLPEGHEYTEKTSISTDGLRVWEQQLSRGYDLQYDENGKLKTNRVAINGDAIVNELGIDVKAGDFDVIEVKNNQEFDIVRQALTPYMESLGLSSSNIYWRNGTVEIDLPILTRGNKAAITETVADALSVEENKVLNERVSSPVRTVALEGIDVAYNGMKGTMKMSDGKMVDNVGDIIPEGNYVFVPKGTNNRAGRKGIVVVGSQEDIDSNAEFVNTESNPSWAPDQNNVANMKLPNGDTLSIMDENLSGNMGLKYESKEFNVEQPNLKTDDTKNKQGVPGGVGGQQAPIQDQSNQGTGTEAATTGGVVQGTQEVDFDGAPAITIEEETDNAAAYDDAMASVVEFDDTLEGDDLDTATAFVQSGATPEEAVRIVRDEKEAMEQASQPATTLTLAPAQQIVVETTTTRPGEYTPSRRTELKNKYKGKPGMATLEYLDKAARAFRKTFSKDTPVFVFETAREMHDALVAQGRNKDFDPRENGAFAYDEDGNVNGIYLNMENADAATAPHEFVHNVLLEVFGQDPEVYIKFRDKILEMFKGSNIDRLKKWAEESYNEESSPEEFITELTAQLAVTDKELELPTTLVDKFKDIMNSVFQSVTGMNVFSDRATKKDVVEFINAMASGLAAGRAIDLQAGKRLAKERAKELAKSKPVSRAKVREQSRKSASQIAAVDAAQASAMSVDDRIMAGRLRDQIAATNPDLDFIMDNFDKIERAMVKEGKLKVNCEL